MSKTTRKHPSPRAEERERRRARQAAATARESVSVSELGIEDFGVLDEAGELPEPDPVAVEVEEDLWPEADRTLDDSIYDRYYEGEEAGKRRRRLKKPSWKGFFKGLLKFIGKILLWVLILVVACVLVGTAIIALVNGTPIEEVPANLWHWILHVITGAKL